MRLTKTAKFQKIADVVGGGCMDYIMMKERILMQIPVNCVMDRQEIYAITTQVNPDFQETLFRNMMEN